MSRDIQRISVAQQQAPLAVRYDLTLPSRRCSPRCIEVLRRERDASVPKRASDRTCRRSACATRCLPLLQCFCCAERTLTQTGRPVAAERAAWKGIGRIWSWLCRESASQGGFFHAHTESSAGTKQSHTNPRVTAGYMRQLHGCRCAKEIDAGVPVDTPAQLWHPTGAGQHPRLSSTYLVPCRAVGEAGASSGCAGGEVVDYHAASPASLTS